MYAGKTVEHMSATERRVCIGRKVRARAAFVSPALRAAAEAFLDAAAAAPPLWSEVHRRMHAVIHAGAAEIVERSTDGSSTMGRSTENVARVVACVMRAQDRARYLWRQPVPVNGRLLESDETLLALAARTLELTLGLEVTGAAQPPHLTEV
jgi:hypothetical protein